MSGLLSAAQAANDVIKMGSGLVDSVQVRCRRILHGYTLVIPLRFFAGSHWVSGMASIIHGEACLRQGQGVHPSRVSANSLAKDKSATVLECRIPSGATLAFWISSQDMPFRANLIDWLSQVGEIFLLLCFNYEYFLTCHQAWL